MLKFSQRIVLLVCAFWLAGPPAACAIDVGEPLVRTFTPLEYSGAVQNWAIAQDPRGVMYVGNVEDGVLEFDGIRWRRIATINRTTVRSLAVSPEGRVYVGAVGELGYLAPDELGNMHYVSLMERIPPEDRDFADVWRTFVARDGVYFSTFNHLIRIGPQGVKVWNPETSFHLPFHLRDTIFIREVGRGLFRLNGDKLEPLPQGERFANEKVDAMLPWPNPTDTTSQAILIGTRTQGWFIWENGTLRPWITQADAAIAEGMLYSAIWLADGRTLAAGTLHSGVFLLGRNGELLQRLDKWSGLASNTSYDLFQDRQGGLWVALDAGISRVDVASPLTKFSSRSGLDGAVIDIDRHKGVLYAGTTQGLYRLQNATPSSTNFVRVPGIVGQTWSFLTVGDTLLVGNLQGVYEIRDREAKLVRPSDQVSFVLLQSAQDPARVFIGLQNGLASIRWQDGHWVDEGTIPGMADEVHTMFQEPNGQLWLGTLSAGVIRVTFPDEQRSTTNRLQPRIERFGREQGLPRSPNLVYTAGGQPVFATTRGLYRFNSRAQKFEPDPRFARLFPEEPRQVVPLKEDSRGRLWMFTNNDAKTIREAGLVVMGADGTYHWDPRPLRQIAGRAIASIYADTDGVMWLGGDDSIFRYDPRLLVDYTRPFEALIREVSDRNGHLLFAGSGASRRPELPFAENSLRFEIAAPHFGFQPNRFQMYLDGVDHGWSPWSTEAYRDYTNIHEGTYTFHVKAMNEFGVVGKPATYNVTVLPPWYRTWWAYISYVVIVLAVFGGGSRWRSMALRQRNLLLAKLIAQRTRELSMANRALQEANLALVERSVTDSLTGLKNRRYLVEHIEHDVAAVRRALQRPSGEPGFSDKHANLFLMMVDVDHFKGINDRHGHAAGDRVIQQLAQILKGACRESDTAVRWGGEEFLLVARFVAPDSAAIFAERIRSVVAAHLFDLGEGRIIRCTCSVGFALFPIFPQDPGRFGWEDTVNLADQSLYEAKRGGRNTWVGVRAADKVPPVDNGGPAGLSRVPVLSEWVSHGYLRRVQPEPPEATAGGVA
jgi:diguanylate cyclase (GGDEF)-like protein